MSSKYIALDLLNSYHPKSRYIYNSALVQAIKFGLLAFVWLLLVFGAGSTVGLIFAWLLPVLIQSLLPNLMPSLTLEEIKSFAEISAILAPTLTIVTVIPVNALFMVLCERKFLSLLTMRIGPNKVGPNGFFQTVADALKLLFKEDTAPNGADKVLFTLAPALFFAPSMIVFLPLLSVASNNAGIYAATDIDIGLIFIMGLVSLGTMSLVMGGWASNNKYSLIGGMRAASQAISYEVPMVLSMIGVVLLSGSANLVEIANQQVGGLLHWNIFASGKIPQIVESFSNSEGSFLQAFLVSVYFLLCISLFLVFFTASAAEVNRIPFDIPEAESELVSGYNTEFSGMKFALFFLAEYTNLFIASALAVVLFFGGPHLPINLELESELFSYLSDLSINLPIYGTFNGVLESLDFSWALSSISLLIKIYLMFLLAIWIRATLPRLRQDQLMEFAWKYLIPISLALIFLIAVLLELIRL
jgi:NADH-quinone oxidoreductase subunit H